jgi:hypothetical protein
MGDRFARHAVAGPEDGRIPTRGHGSDAADVAEPDWIETLASLDECDGYVVLMVDPQTGEVDAHGPFGGPDAAVTAESLRASLDAEDLGDVAVRIVRLHLPSGAS